jgi:hypothetical protein
MIMDQIFVNEWGIRFYVLSFFFCRQTTYFRFLYVLCGYKIYACLHVREFVGGRNKIMKSRRLFKLRYNIYFHDEQ